VPQKGEITIFNRSYYEDILIQYVHGWIDDKRRDVRMEAINAFEKLLDADNNTTVLKFFLNIGYEKQEEKLTERVNVRKKQWKHSDGDWEERKLWDKYQTAYQYILDNSKIKWTTVPCDNDWYRNYVVAKELHKTLTDLNPKYPELVSKIFKK
jgi:polyphosphate kinase 2 (PPK2 family)